MSRRNRSRAPTGLIDSEREIMDRWDAGQSIEAITANTRFSKGYVYSTVSNYHGDERRRDERRINNASQRLLAAIQRAGAAGCAS